MSRFWILGWSSVAASAACLAGCAGDPAEADDRHAADVTSAAATGDPLAGADAGTATASAAASASAPAEAASATPAFAGDAGPREAATADAGASDGGAAAGDGCPAGMARINRYCIDRYEAHLVRREAAPSDAGALPASTDGAGGAPGREAVVPWPHHQRPEPGVRYEARSEPGFFPQAYISRVEAKAACAAAGKRLCSMAEWLRACRGKRGATYPWGGRWEAGRCNSAKPHLLQLRFGGDARRWKYDENFNDPSLDQEPGFLARSGEHERCAGDDGVYDLVGNLHEWVSDTVDEDLMERLDAEDVERNKQPWRTGNGVFLGGFFSTLRELGPGCRFVTVAHEPTYHDYSTGFRCCAAATGLAPEKRPAKPKKPPAKR